MNTKGQVDSQKGIAGKEGFLQLLCLRQACLKAPSDHPVSYFHFISRVVDRRFVLGDLEKEQFVV